MHLERAASVAAHLLVVPQSASTNAELTKTLFTLPMASGATWTLTAGDLLILLSLFMLFFELLKATTSRRVAIVNHSLSMIVFIVCLVEFLLVPAFATSVCFLSELEHEVLPAGRERYSIAAWFRRD